MGAWRLQREKISGQVEEGCPGQDSTNWERQSGLGGWVIKGMRDGPGNMTKFGDMARERLNERNFLRGTKRQ